MNAETKAVPKKKKYRVQLKLKDGEEIKGRLMRVEDSNIVLKTFVNSEEKVLFYPISAVEEVTV